LTFDIIIRYCGEMGITAQSGWDHGWANGGSAVNTGDEQHALVGIMPTDLLTFAGMAALFFLIAGLATWIPARHAAALNPSVAQREE
jgi:hypothetical protein